MLIDHDFVSKMPECPCHFEDVERERARKRDVETKKGARKGGDPEAQGRTAQDSSSKGTERSTEIR